MKRLLLICLLLGLLVVVRGAVRPLVEPTELESFDLVLTNLLADVAAELARRPALQPLPWTDPEPPTNTLPRAVDEAWSFLGGRLARAPARLAVWTLEGPGGASWLLLAEAQVGTGRSNVVRRALGPGVRRSHLPADWE